VPHCGNWINRNSMTDAIPKVLSPGARVEDLPPAGLRLPKTLKISYPDNIPLILEKLQGSPEATLKKRLNAKKEAAMDRYGNRSTVGMLIKSSNEDPLLQRMRLDKDQLMRAVLQKDVSEYNKQFICKAKNAKSMNVSRMQLSTEDEQYTIQTLNAANRAIFSNISNPPDYIEKEHRFNTNSRDVHTPKPLPDFSAFKKNFKRKSVFQQWTEANYNHGVYFNPGVNCL
jgi:hypothetical protein